MLSIHSCRISFCFIRLIKRTGRYRQNLRISILTFSNSDFSVDIASICTKFLGYVPNSTPEGSVSQNFDLGPG